jgi:ABC-type microcin C transport system permease subunit YejB
MRNYIIKRLLLIPLTLLGILTINFLIIQTAPGGPVEHTLAKYRGFNVDSKSQFTSTASENRQPQSALHCERHARIKPDFHSGLWRGQSKHTAC